MLLKCPECGLQVSDKAMNCPHCGYPMILPSKKRKPYGQHRRLPNGFGRITKISGQNLRNPYRAMVTIGKTPEGRPISKILKPKGYFKTYNDAYAALIEYNRNPYDFKDDMTVDELHTKWLEEHSKLLSSEGTKRNFKTAWNYCSGIKNMKVSDLRVRHLKRCIYEGKYKEHEAPSNVKTRIKSMFNMMLDYAVEYELIERNYARSFELNSDTKIDLKGVKKNHIAFTQDELNILWDSLDVPYVDVLLIQCYSGWRPQELGLIRLDSVDLNERTIVSGMKTEAGKNRLVPIHPKIYPLVLMKYKTAVNLGSKYLLNCVDSSSRNYELTYPKYRKRFNSIVEQLGLNPNHRPHDGRKTFVTLAKKYKVDEYAVKYIAGHTINDITERVYTERDPAWLKEEIKKIK